jgi:hypothetical protein
VYGEVKMRSSKKIVGYMVLGISFYATNIQAEEAPLYIGVNYGSSDMDSGRSGLTGTAMLDEKDSGFKIYTGYSINDTVSIEGHYLNFGEVSLKGNQGDQFTYKRTVYTMNGNNYNNVSEIKSFGVSGVVKLPVSDILSPFIKVGLQKWDVDTTVNSLNGGVSLNKDGTDIFYGVGVGVSVNKSLSIRGEFERFDIDGRDTDYLSFGLAYKI